ncbi:Multi antimicrobial extrusion protein family protein [Pseudohyphozyma bogoriensis]|nr:Multi antimicrobial extrusion protein family protein [Pseudohyphozyma bogoriensis]
MLPSHPSLDSSDGGALAPAQSPKRNDSLPPDERTPLLATRRLDEEDEEEDRPESVRKELGVLVGFMGPILGSSVLEYSLFSVTVFVVGHLGTTQLAAASLANLTSNVFCISIIQGFAGALDTLATQAYTGPNPKDASLYTIRTFIILLVIAIPQFIILWNSEPLLLLLRQDPAVSSAAASYLKVLSFGLPGIGGFECTRRWLQAQGLMFGPVFTLLICCPVNIFLNWLLVWGPESVRMGFIGAPVATTVTLNLLFIVSLVYCYFYAPRDAWGGWTWAVFRDLGPNFKLGLAGTAMLVSEWWSWEVIALAAAFLGPADLAANSIAVSSAALFFQIPMSLSITSSVRVGNLIGAQKPRMVKQSSRIAILFSASIGFTNSVALFFCRNVWGKLFTSDGEVISRVATVLPLVALFQLGDSVSGCGGGILRGAGRATLGAVINIISYYGFCLPIGLSLCFYGPKLGLEGLWIGLCCGLMSAAAFMTVFVWKMDWPLECRKSELLLSGNKSSSEEEA